MKKLLFELKILFIPCLENEYKPCLLQSRLLVYYLLILLVFKIVFASLIFYLPKTVFFADVTKSILFNVTNQEREALGFNALTENPKLNEAAYQKAQDMLRNDYFSHQSPDGLTPWYWFKQADYVYRAAGENLAIGFLDSEEVVRAWLESPSHRSNLLNPGFKEMGIAVLTGDFNGKETTVVVQHFGSLAVQVAEKEIKEVESPLIEEKPVEQVIPIKAVAGTGVLEFITVDYPNIFERIVLYSLIFIISILFLAVLIKIKIQNRQLILKAVVFIVLLGLFFFTNKEFIVQFIPHQLII